MRQLLLTTQMQTVNKKEFLRHALTYGAYTGAVMMIASYITGLITGTTALGGIIIYIVLSIGILLGQKSWTLYRKPDPTPFFQATLYGITCGIGASIINALYVVTDLKLIHPNALDPVVEMSKQMLEQMKMFSQQDIEQATATIETIKIPMAIISYFLYNLFLSAIFSAISAFLSLLQKK